MRIRNVLGFCVSALAVGGLGTVTPVVALAATGSPATNAAATSAPAPDYTALGRLPNWSGVWVIPEPRFVEALFAETTPGNPRAPVLTADNLAKLNAYNTRRMTGVDPPGVPPLRTNTELCLPTGMPAVMRDPVGNEFLFTPGRVTVISEAGPTIRRIYTDPKRTPRDEGEQNFSGRSLGHWEGQTLVVDTTEISPHSQLLATLRTSGQAHVTERMYLKDADHLQIDTVVSDPGAMKSPWRYSRLYDRLGADIGMREDVCLENNRDTNGGEPDLTPPK